MPFWELNLHLLDYSSSTYSYLPFWGGLICLLCKLVFFSNDTFSWIISDFLPFCFLFSLSRTPVIWYWTSWIDSLSCFFLSYFLSFYKISSELYLSFLLRFSLCYISFFLIKKVYIYVFFFYSILMFLAKSHLRIEIGNILFLFW